MFDLSKFIAIDNHAHSIERHFLQLDKIAFRHSFSESKSLSLLNNDLGFSLSFVDFLNNLQRVTGSHSEEEFLSKRIDYDEIDYMRRLFDDVSLTALIIDDGFGPDSMLELGELAEWSGRTIFCCRRIETVLEQLIPEVASFDELQATFAERLLRYAGAEIVGLKTIAAYRGGLNIETISAQDARRDFDSCKRELSEQLHNHILPRIGRRPLYHHMLLSAFEIAGEQKLPIQVHTGIGDDDALLSESNPLCLQKLLKSQLFDKTKFVLLHGYPYVKEAAYLASLYNNVFLDLSLAMNLNSLNAVSMLRETLSLTPYNKLLAGSDGHSTPEAHWWGMHSWRRALSQLLDEFIDSGLLSENQAEDLAAAVLHGNAMSLYKLEGLV